jgi:uncharacterized Zn-finger protein
MVHSSVTMSWSMIHFCWFKRFLRVGCDTVCCDDSVTPRSALFFPREVGEQRETKSASFALHSSLSNSQNYLFVKEMASVLRHVKFQDDSRKPLFPVSTNLPTKMRPPQVNIPACRPSATTAPPRENELEPVQERLAAFICKWRGCTAILASSSILRGHVRTCHCLQSFREVTSSSVSRSPSTLLFASFSSHLQTRKRSRYSCQYDNCRQQGYISSDELLTHIVTDHFLDIKLPALQDGASFSLF